MAAWLSHCDMYARLCGSINADFGDVVDVVGSEMEKKKYKLKKKNRGDSESPPCYHCQKLIRMLTEVYLYRFSNSSDHGAIERISFRPVACPRYRQQH